MSFSSDLFQFIERNPAPPVFKWILSSTMMLYYSAMETVNNFWAQICLLSRGRENQCTLLLKQAPDSFRLLKRKRKARDL